MQVHNIKRLGQQGHCRQLIVSKVEVCQSRKFLKIRGHMKVLFGMLNKNTERCDVKPEYEMNSL